MKVICSYCGNEFEKTKSKIARSKKHFCNQMCKSSHQSEKMKAYEQPNFKKGNKEKAINNLCYQLRSLGYHVDKKAKVIKSDSIASEDMPRINKLIHTFDFKINHDSQVQTRKPVRCL